MNVIEFTGVWKKFRKGEKFNSLRDALPNYASFLFARKKEKPALGDMEFWALQDLTFAVPRGDIVGIIGPNGAGKSTVLKLLSRIMVPDRGSINIQGRLSALIEVTAGFHPELTGRENIFLNGTIMGMSRREIDSKFDEIVEFSGLKEFINTPVKRYSSGMYSRLGFSVAAHMDPDIMLVDEVLSVGDMAFQSKCIRKMKELLSSGATIVLVSHDLALVQNLCKRVILIDEGQSLKEGPAARVIPFYQELVNRKSEEELQRQLAQTGRRVRVSETSRVELRNVTLRDALRRPARKFSAGEPIYAQVEFRAAERIEQPVFSLEVVRADGVVCCDSSTLADGCPVDAIEGDGEIEVGLENLRLAPGIYVIKVTVWDREMLHPYAIRNKDIIRIGQTDTDAGVQRGVFVTSYSWKRPAASAAGVGQA